MERKVGDIRSFFEQQATLQNTHSSKITSTSRTHNSKVIKPNVPPASTSKTTRHSHILSSPVSASSIGSPDRVSPKSTEALSKKPLDNSPRQTVSDPRNNVARLSRLFEQAATPLSQPISRSTSSPNVKLKGPPPAPKPASLRAPEALISQSKSVDYINTRTHIAASIKPFENTLTHINEVKAESKVDGNPFDDTPSLPTHPPSNEPSNDLSSTSAVFSSTTKKTIPSRPLSRPTYSSIPPIPARPASLAESHPSPREDTKRLNVIKELIETEKSFLNDMIVLKEVYYEPARQDKILTNSELKMLFCNLHDVIDMATVFSTELEASNDIGRIFLDQLPQIEQVYCEYCKQNENALAKAAEMTSSEGPMEVREFFKQCQVHLQGRTGAWDFSSLLIKPVQRVLKYPLLLKQLLKETDSHHSDYQNIVLALDSIENVAEKINQVKKRIDIVEKYIDGKGGSNVIHGINKKITRGAQQFKMGIGMNESTVDSDYKALEEEFQNTLKLVQDCRQHIVKWVLSFNIMFERQISLLNVFQVMYTEDITQSHHSIPPDASLVLSDYLQAIQRISTSGCWSMAENKMNHLVLVHFDDLLAMFKGPVLLMKKRDKKSLDYDRAKAIRSKGEEVDKSLQTSVDAYMALNDQLKDELPKLFDLVEKCLAAILTEFATIQSETYQAIFTQLLPIANYLGDGHASQWTAEYLMSKYTTATQPDSQFEVAARELKILTKWHAMMWPGMDPIPTDSTPSSPSKYILTGGFLSTDTSTSEGPLSKKSDASDPFGRVAVVMYDFQAEFEDEMSIKEGDTLAIDESAPERQGWLFARNPYTEEMGYVPASYCSF